MLVCQTHKMYPRSYKINYVPSATLQVRREKVKVTVTHNARIKQLLQTLKTLQNTSKKDNFNREVASVSPQH